MNYLDLHKKIDKFFEDGPEKASASFVFDELHIEDDYDLRNYFFHVASQYDNVWFDWIDQTVHLFTEIKKGEDKARNSKVNASELDYLTNMVEKYPEGVARVVGEDDNATKKNNFNPVIVGRFLWIISKLPAKQISELTNKILQDGWIKNRGAFNRTGYEFSEMIEKLAEAKEYDALLELSQAILEVKDLDERDPVDIEGHTMYRDSHFYLRDITQSGVFEKLLEVDIEHKEKVVRILSGIIKSITTHSGRESKDNFFTHTDEISMYDENLFAIELEDGSGYRSNIDDKNLIVVLLRSLRDLIGKHPNDEKEIKSFVSLLPERKLSRLSWRMHLTVMSWCPEVFKTELEKMFFKVFEVDNYYDVEGGPEYEEALKRSFGVIEKKEEYIKRVFEFFTEQNKKHSDQKWHLRTGWEILSSIPQEFLTDADKEKCKKLFGARPDENYRPEPGMSKITSGTVQPRSPDISEMEVKDIFEKIKKDWTPSKLKEEYKNDDFLRPRGAEGLGDALKGNLIKQPAKYLDALISEKNLEKFAAHYVYSMMRGLEDMSRDKYTWKDTEIDKLIEVFIKTADLCVTQKLFEAKTDEEGSWLANWATVHKPIVDVLLHIVSQGNIKEYLNNPDRRNKILELFGYVLKVPGSPSPENEDPKYGDLYHIAINSVRGRAFEAFTVFIEKDGKALSEQSKRIYEDILKDTSLAVRFVIGRYLAPFYFRDKEFISERLEMIFPKNSNKELFLAAWGGYLSSSLYNDLFEKMESYYRHAIGLSEHDHDFEKDREYIRDHSLNKALAIHMALAFAHLGYDYKEGGIVAEFWAKDNAERFAEFISFIGRSLLTRENAGKKFLEDQKVELGRLVKFWEWVLEEKGDMGHEIFGGFGFWINQDKEIISDDKLVSLVARTLKKAKGACDWELGLMKRLPVWAEKQDSRLVLDIVRDYLLLDGKLNNKTGYPLIYKEEIKKALGIIYKNGNSDIQSKVKQLINDLWGAGSQMFWDFEDILK